ncbi:MAG: hypothetical protein ACE5IY_07695 [bacterium]
MKILDVLSTGLRRVNSSKRYIFVVYGVNLLLALVLGGALAVSLAGSIGNSVAGEKLLQSFDELWYPNFAAQAKGVARTFDPSVVGIGAVFNGLDTLLQGNFFDTSPAVAGVGLFYLLLWTFFSAGFVSLYAAGSERPSFLHQAAHFFPRFLILGLMAGVLYFLLFKFVLGWLTKAVDELTRETIDERVHFTYTVLKYLILWFGILSVNILLDYSKIFTVLKNHKNAFTAPLGAMKVVFGNFLKTYGLYMTLGLLWVALLSVCWLIAPGAGQSSWLMIFAAFLVGQLYVLSRIWTRCLFYAGQTTLCSALTASE